MTLQEMIEQGRSLIETNGDHYYWLITVEEYLDALPNSSYANKAKQPIKDCRFFGRNKDRKQDAVRQIVAILQRIYDNEQEKFLRENINMPLLSMFEDARVNIVKNEFELSIQFKNEGRYQQSVVEVCKSLESMMKVVCKHRGIAYNEKDTYNNLVKILKDNEILPLNGMVDGHQVMRNKASGHGADEDTYDPKKEDAVFEINRGAALLIYLYEKSGM